MDSKTEAAAIIAKLGLQPHPEGGWYRQTWQGPLVNGRATGTAIHFLLQPGELLRVCQDLRVVAYEDGYVAEPERFVQRIVAVREVRIDGAAAPRYPLDAAG